MESNSSSSVKIVGRKRKRIPNSQTSSRATSSTLACLVGLAIMMAYVHFGLSVLSLGEQPSSRKTMLEPHDNTEEEQQLPLLEPVPKSIDPHPRFNSSLSFLTTPLQDVDFEKYTVRINTWKRQDQLRVSIQHFLSCPRVAVVQIVWCTAQGHVPTWLEEWQANEPSRLVVETHEENSLNARFDVLIQPPTKGILTVDDDVLRPCFAFDVAFAKWTSHPDRLVGFDARTHVVDPHTGTWKYGYLSETTRSNRYSLTLSRCAFVHVDHLRSYTRDIPAEYRAMVAEHMNCEDILLSMWTSHLTDCQPPLLADFWTMRSMIKMFSPQAISATSGHKQIRDQCVDTFRRGFQLDCLQRADGSIEMPSMPTFPTCGRPAHRL